MNSITKEELYQALEEKITKKVIVDRNGLQTIEGVVMSVGSDSFTLTDEQGTRHNIKSSEMISLS